MIIVNQSFTPAREGFDQFGMILFLSLIKSFIKFTIVCPETIYVLEIRDYQG
jgi:hypothetical protein